MEFTSENPKRGYYEGVDNRNVFHRIPRHIDPDLDGTCLVVDREILFPLDKLPNELAVKEFDELLINSIPKEILNAIDDVIARADNLVNENKAEPVAQENRIWWKRGMILSWVHSRDIETIMHALGHPKILKGKHDIEEFVKAKYIKNRLQSADGWYKELILSLDDEDEINIGFFNPNFSGSLFNWGLKKMGTQNAMDAHRLSDHHLGNPDHPLNLVEKAANFVIHHLPREHFGIRHESRGDWENIEEVMAVDHSTKDNPILRLIARDAGKIIKLLEEEGKIVPWQLLNPKYENPIPRNIELKGQGSTTLREVEIFGGVIYCPEKNNWTLSGMAGWSIATAHSGDPLSIRITFFEPLEEGYNLEVTPINTGGEVIVKANILFANEEGFRIVIETPFDLRSNKIGFNFSIKGIKKQIVPDDRTIKPEQLNEDIFAVNNILTHEAEYGMVTVMCSASIRPQENHQKEKERRNNELKEAKEALSKTRVNDEINRLKKEIRKIEARLLRLDKLINSSKYWESANRFGKMWGNYCATTQNSELGGRYIPVCTGGGPGIMEAVARGAREENAQVLGIDSIFGNDNRHDLENDFSIFSNVRLRCNDFAIREAALINYSHVILFWPGGYGTTWEAFETLCKIQTNHLRRGRTKAIFVHQEFWMPLYEYTKHLQNMGTVNSLTDRIKVSGIDDQDLDEYYVGEIVKDENEAFEKTRNYIHSLYLKNQLQLR